MEEHEDGQDQLLDVAEAEQAAARQSAEEAADRERQSREYDTQLAIDTD